jgi:hypothetical protein
VKLGNLCGVCSRPGDKAHVKLGNLCGVCSGPGDKAHVKLGNLCGVCWARGQGACEAWKSVWSLLTHEFLTDRTFLTPYLARRSIICTIK